MHRILWHHDCRQIAFCNSFSRYVLLDIRTTPHSQNKNIVLRSAAMMSATLGSSVWIIDYSFPPTWFYSKIAVLHQILSTVISHRRSLCSFYLLTHKIRQHMLWNNPNTIQIGVFDSWRQQMIHKHVCCKQHPSKYPCLTTGKCQIRWTPFIYNTSTHFLLINWRPR